MLVAIGKIVSNRQLAGIRIYDTVEDCVKDIEIVNCNKDIKNMHNIDYIGVLDNKKEQKPIIILERRQGKYLTVDINGNKNIMTEIEIRNHYVLNIKSNIEQYKEYEARMSLIGEKVFEFEINEETDDIEIVRYKKSLDENRVIEIPSFVTKIRTDNTIFNVTQNLKVIHRNNKIKDMSYLFCGFMGNKLDLSEFDTTNVLNMNCMFTQCSFLSELNINGFKTNQVRLMNGMFNRCSKLRKLDLSGFDTSKVETMGSMFSKCKSLKILKISNFDTSNVTSMAFMFGHCRFLSNIDVSGFDTSKVRNMSYMFTNCDSIQYIDVSGFNTEKVENIQRMFNGCYRLKKLDLSNFKLSKCKIKDRKDMLNCTIRKELTGLKYKVE